MSDSLSKEFDYYLEHQNEIVAQYNGKVVAIKGGRILGAYDSDIEAVEGTSKTEELGTFIVQRVSPGPDDYTRTFHSRVTFA